MREPEIGSLWVHKNTDNVVKVTKVDDGGVVVQYIDGTYAFWARGQFLSLFNSVLETLAV